MEGSFMLSHIELYSHKGCLRELKTFIRFIFRYVRFTSFERHFKKGIRNLSIFHLMHRHNALAAHYSFLCLLHDVPVRGVVVIGVVVILFTSLMGMSSDWQLQVRTYHTGVLRVVHNFIGETFFGVKSLIIRR